MAHREKRCWYTADEIAQITADGLGTSHAQAERWLVEGLRLLGVAADAGRLTEAVAESPSSVAEHLPGLDAETTARYDALIAAAVRWRLRVLRTEGRSNVADPHWVRTEPLERLWFPNPLPSRMPHAMATSPMELRRVGIMIPVSALR